MTSIYNIGESTLETLPGTLTPPSAKYSPHKKLTDDCISITSTPKSTASGSTVVDLNLIKGFNLGLIKKKNWQTGGNNHHRGNHLDLSTFNRKRVNFEDDPQTVKQPLFGVDKKNHYKLIKNRQKMYRFYKSIKFKKFKYVDNLWISKSREKKTKWIKRKNVGDLI